MPEQQIPRRHGKDPVQPKEHVYQDYTEEGDDQGYFEGDNFTTEVDLEMERLKRLLAKKDQVNQDSTHQLAEAKKKQAGRPKKKKSKSTRRNETGVIETATIYTEAQTRTGPMTRQQAQEQPVTYKIRPLVCRCLRGQGIHCRLSDIRLCQSDILNKLGMILFQLLIMVEARGVIELQIRIRATMLLITIILISRTGML